jgi:hypothetical protein
VSYIIQRTNPDYIAHTASWRCASCRSIYATEAEARDCAVDDHAKRNAKREAA